MRLDKVLASRYREIHSRTYFQNLIEGHNVLVNGSIVKKRIRLNVGDEVEICFVLTPEIDLTPEPIPLDIIYEDDHILVVNKPAGMVVHPAPGNWTGTFVNALLYHCKQLPGGSTLRPGIVHRLDKDTSGLLIAAKTPIAQSSLIESFSSREIDKEYLAICVGNPGKKEIREPIGRHPVHRQKMAVTEKGRASLTIVETLAFNGSLSLVKLILATGRTHQIRVHMQHARTPVLGDAVYGNLQANEKYGAKRQMLHAYILKFLHPVTKKPLEFKAEPPADMKKFLERFPNWSMTDR
jgi:23S rRNA pseudouridine1911/1915/1917 synthase